MKNYKINSKKESGFTLVELAIVMIIIGLLIGGILKGQQLIANAEISSTVAMIKTVDTGMNTFRDAYAAIPGDLSTPATRIQDCTLSCARVGDANGRIGAGTTAIPGAARADVNNENGAAWAQMAAADVMGGINSTAATTTAPGLLNTLPVASVGGSLQIGFSPDGALTAASGGANSPAGHYLILDVSGAATTADATAGLTQAEAARIDRKMDDGLPNTGSVRGMGPAGTGGCAGASGPTGLYLESENTITCGLYFRVQS